MVSTGADVTLPYSFKDNYLFLKCGGSYVQIIDKPNTRNELWLLKKRSNMIVYRLDKLI